MPRPAVTLTYAQSLDGCLALEPGRGLALSGPEAQQFTHQLRAAHDAILIGAGTVLADDPQLTVRQASGANPQPIVLDSRLRFPLQARLLRHPTHQVWIATTAAAPAERERALTAAGARLLHLPNDADGRVNLPALLEALAADGVRRLMVEGGAQVITSFLRAGLVDRLIITIAPRLLGGVHAVAAPVMVELRDPQVQVLGPDVIVEADVVSASPTAQPEPSAPARGKA